MLRSISLCALAPFALTLLFPAMGRADFAPIAGGTPIATTGNKDGGAIFADLNNDGFLDIIVNTNSGNDTRMYISSGGANPTFTDVTAQRAPGFLGFTLERSIIAADLNNDGCVDLVRNTSPRLEIYLNSCAPSYNFGIGNNPNSSYTQTGIGGLPFNTEGIGVIDVDRDGWYDLVVDNHRGFLTWMNPGDGTANFAIVGSGPTGLPTGVNGIVGDYLAATDYDLDGEIDIVNRHSGLAEFYANNGNGTFTQDPGNPDFAGPNSNKGGNALCDFDNDGDFDLFYSDGDTGTGAAPNRIYLQNATGNFVVSTLPGLPGGTNIDGVQCEDVDNDGDLDLYLSNSGNDFLFINTLELGALGFIQHTQNPALTFGAPDGEAVAMADYDNDGDVDIYVNQDTANELYRNDVNDQNYLMVRALRSTGVCPGPLGATPALGATVVLENAAGAPVSGIREVNAGRGHGGMGTPVVHFGLPGGPNLEYFVHISYKAGLSQDAIVPVTPSQIAGYQVLAIETNDFDGDTISNADEIGDSAALGNNDPDGDGVLTWNDVDSDGDGFSDEEESGDINPCTTPRDTDSDGTPDYLDLDSDNDGVDDDLDPEPLDPNVCQDSDADGCDDCTNTGANSSAGDGANDGLDTDGDGACDAGDIDDDGDGVNDAFDREPLNPFVCRDVDNDSCDDCTNTGANGSGGDPANDGVDTDGDGICDLGDVVDDPDGDGVLDRDDPDDDNDGIPDTVEFGGNDPSADADGDDVPNYLDPDYWVSQGDSCPDADSNGECDSLPAAADFDQDGIPNHFDRDSDNDGLSDALEGGGTDADGDGVIDGCVDVSPMNGECDSVDAMPLPVPNTDGSAGPDFLDLDSDNDGITDAAESGGSDADGDGLVDGFVDVDSHGVPDSGLTVSPVDTDGNSVPDYVSLDADDDGIPDAIEGHDVDADGVADVAPSGTDTDGDGLDDSYDADAPGGVPAPLPDFDGDTAPDYLDDDDDDDGIPTATEVFDGATHGVDPDGDGDPNYLDLDSDGDGSNDTTEFGFDLDADNIPDYLDANSTVADTDGDGIADIVECPPPGVVTTPATCPDSDGDGLPDFNDPDDDNDGVPTLDEVTEDPTPDNDFDEDGIPSHLDIDSDGDGITDGDECGVPLPCSDSDADGTPDFLENDADDDGIPDSTEGHDVDMDGVPDTVPTRTDTDNDGLDDAFDPDSGGTSAPSQDTDADGTPDYQDIDSDGDGLTDAFECRSGAICSDTDDDGTPDYLDLDSDGDGLPDSFEGTLDTDGDGEPDYRDTDADDDTVPDDEEAGDDDLTTPPIDTDGDGTPDFRDFDSDNDGELDSSDNCRIVVNPGQEDSDGDGVGDACDDGVPAADTDGDGVIDAADNCPTVPNADQADENGDNVGDLCETVQYSFSLAGGGCEGVQGPKGWLSLALPLLLFVVLRRRTRH